MRNRNTALKRRLRIAERVRRDSSVRANELAEDFDVSVVTIRTDLGYLEERGYVIRSFGGAISASGHSKSRLDRPPEPPAEDDVLRLHQRLGCWLPETGTVFLGGALLAQRLLPAVSRRPDLLMITDAPAVAAQASVYPLADLIVTGGRYRPVEGVCIGQPTDDLTIDVAFVPLNDQSVADTLLGRHYQRIAARSAFCCGVAAGVLDPASLAARLGQMDVMILAPSAQAALAAILEASGFSIAEAAADGTAVYARPQNRCDAWGQSFQDLRDIS